MTKEQATLDDMNITPEELKETPTENESLQRNVALVRWCVDNVPLPPPNYHFSLRQRIEQFDFFQNKLDLYPSRYLDLYNATIVIARNSENQLLFSFSFLRFVLF